MSFIERAPKPPARIPEPPDPTKRGWRGYVRVRPRSIVPYRDSRNDPVMSRGCRWIIPWLRRDYPGLYPGLEELFAGRADSGTIKSWLGGFRKAPAWSIEIVADYIERRCVVGWEIAAELRQAMASRGERKPSGWAVVGADGRDGRPKTGRGKRKEV